MTLNTLAEVHELFDQIVRPSAEVEQEIRDTILDLGIVFGQMAACNLRQADLAIAQAQNPDPMAGSAAVGEANNYIALLQSRRDLINTKFGVLQLELKLAKERESEQNQV